MSEQDDRWLERHGLERDPFPESDSGGEFFSRGGRERQLDTLADPAASGRPLVAVIGDAGVGKSTLFHALLRRLPEGAHVARVTAGVFLSARSLLAALARAMGEEADGDTSRPELRRLVHERVAAIVAAGQRCIVLVDDAGELEADALDELVQVAEIDPDGGHVRVVLFALPGIRDALGKASGGQRVGPLLQEMMIERYSLNELRGYLQFRLARAGLQGASPFTDEEYAEIFRRSGGIPGRANGLAGRMLRTRAAGLPRRQLYFAAGGAAAALLLAALLIVLFGGGDSSPPTRATSASATPAGGGPAELPELLPATEPLPEVRREVQPEAPRELQPEPASTPRPVSGPRELDAAEQDLAGSWIDALQNPTPARAAPVAQPPPEPQRTAAVATAPAATTEPEVTVEPPPASDGRRALEDLDPDHYVLQLLVNSTPTRARSWIEDQQDPEAFHVYERVRDGVAQYVVVYGDFQAQADAAQATERVAAATGIDAPWIRRVADVQRELQDR
jgi:type II secretory pathway predicted ATPase ExeA